MFLKIVIPATLVIFFPSATASYQITFAWDANTEPDLAGYELYGKQGSPCPPYDYIDTYPIFKRIYFFEFPFLLTKARNVFKLFMFLISKEQSYTEGFLISG